MRQEFNSPNYDVEVHEVLRVHILHTTEVLRRYHAPYLDYFCFPPVKYVVLQ